LQLLTAISYISTKVDACQAGLATLLSHPRRKCHFLSQRRDKDIGELKELVHTNASRGVSRGIDGKELVLFKVSNVFGVNI
jgi:hypothetical protein